MNEWKVASVAGRAVPVTGNDIDTDRIIPARYLKEITFFRLGEYPFFDERFHADGRTRAHAFNEPRFLGAAILLANANFGCGSSREHAPQALMRWGIRAIVAESYGEIFANNCVMLGIPAVVASRGDVAVLQRLAEHDPEAGFVVDLDAMTVTAGNIGIALTMPASHRKSLLDGTWDTTGMLLANAGLANQTAQRLERTQL